MHILTVIRGSLNIVSLKDDNHYYIGILLMIFKGQPCKFYRKKYFACLCFIAWIKQYYLQSSWALLVIIKSEDWIFFPMIFFFISTTCSNTSQVFVFISNPLLW